MSADGWAICPLCVEDARAEHDRKVREVNAAYGKVSAEEYRAMDAALPDEFDPYSLEPTVREDYEIGFESMDPNKNEGWLIYKGVCQKCNASVEFEHKLELAR